MLTNLFIILNIFQSINVVDNPELRDLLLFVGCHLQEKDLPH
jgi:hypothetical protein